MNITYLLTEDTCLKSMSSRTPCSIWKRAHWQRRTHGLHYSLTPHYFGKFVFLGEGDVLGGGIFYFFFGVGVNFFWGGFFFGGGIFFWGDGIYIYIYIYICLQYGTVQYNTVQYSTVQYSTVQYSTVQYSTGQYTVQYSTVPPNPQSWWYGGGGDGEREEKVHLLTHRFHLWGLWVKMALHAMKT